MTTKEIIDAVMEKIGAEKIGAEKMIAPDDVSIKSFKSLKLYYYYYKGIAIIPNSNNYTWVYSHLFAKAFWGEELVQVMLNDEVPLFTGVNTIEIVKQVAWAYHLTKMVLEEDPFKYLERFL